MLHSLLHTNPKYSFKIAKTVHYSHSCSLMLGNILLGKRHQYFRTYAGISGAGQIQTEFAHFTFLPNMNCYWVKTECTQTAYKTQIKNLYVKKRRTNLQILEYKKYLCNPPPPPRTNIGTLHKHYTNWNSDLLLIIITQSSGKRRHGGENFIWKSLRCLVARMVGS